MEPINTKITFAEPFGRAKVGNITLEDARFWGKPNFSGEEDQFKDSRRKFSVLIPNELADQMREIGWNVKTTMPTQEEMNEGREPTSGLKVMVDISADRGPDVWLIMGQEREKLTINTIGTLDRSRVIGLDMEIRGWEYDPEDKPGELSARLVQLVAVIQPNLLQAKHGVL